MCTYKKGKVDNDCGNCGCRTSANYGNHDYRESDVIVRVGGFTSKAYKCYECGSYR